MKNKWKKAILTILLLAVLITGCNPVPKDDIEYSEIKNVTLDAIPEYSGSLYVEINNNVPDFSEKEFVTDAFEYYSDLDELGRCGAAYANICQELMPTEERGNIGSIKPSGWHTVKYNGIVDGNYLYNRCHLIGFQLAGENANEKNLITGTRYFNVEGMLPFEGQVADYVQETDHHVLYRVTPIYDVDNLVASGVQMEAASVEDDEIRFNVFVYNIQPGITIDYSTGESWISEEKSDGERDHETEVVYILNKNTKKFHLPDCEAVEKIKPQNRSEANVLVACDEVIAPVEMDGFSYQGLTNLFLEVQNITENGELNPFLNFRGIYMVKAERYTTLFRQLYGAYQNQLGEFFLQSTIRKNICVAECSANSKPLLHYRKRSNALEDYILLTKELGYISEKQMYALLKDHATSKELRDMAETAANN